MSRTPRQVGYVGLGAMGGPMATNLAAAFTTKVYNRTTDVALSHEQQYNTVAVAHLGDLADVEVVCTCLPTDVEVAAVAAELGPRLAEGTLWLDHTSGAPDGTREIAAQLEAEGVHYLDAPVSGGVAGAVAGTLTTMVGGDEEALERARVVLEVVADRIVHVGPVGAGMAVKAANQAMLAANLWSASEALAAVAKAGVPTSLALEVINGSSGRSFVSETLVPRAVRGDLALTFALTLLAKDVDLAAAMAEEAGLGAPVVALVRELTREAADELGDDVDHIEVVRILERRAGIELG